MDKRVIDIFKRLVDLAKSDPKLLEELEKAKIYAHLDPIVPGESVEGSKPGKLLADLPSPDIGKRPEVTGHLPDKKSIADQRQRIYEFYTGKKAKSQSKELIPQDAPMEHIEDMLLHPDPKMRQAAAKLRNSRMAQETPPPFKNPLKKPSGGQEPPPAA